jgi:hypothetical protein
VAAIAKASGQVDREEVARARARALEVKVPRLFIEVPAANRVPGLQIQRDGVLLGEPQWQTPIPLDPGEHAIVASVPNGRTWNTTINLQRDSVTMKVVIPSLAGPIARTSLSLDPAPLPPEESRSDGKTQRLIGVVVGGAGLVGIGVGTFFGFQSMARHDDAVSLCKGDVCTSHGTELRAQAITAGDVATIALIAGGVAVAGGAVLYLTAPHATTLRAGLGGLVAEARW